MISSVNWWWSQTTLTEYQIPILNHRMLVDVHNYILYTPITRVTNCNITLQYHLLLSDTGILLFFFLILMFQTASPIHYPFLASQLWAFPRGSILISTYPWTARHLFRQENVLCKGESTMMWTLLAKWDWFFLKTFTLTWGLTWDPKQLSISLSE